MKKGSEDKWYFWITEGLLLLIAGCLTLGGYWMGIAQVHLGIIQTDFITTFTIACAIIWIFLFLGRLGALAEKFFPAWFLRGLSEGWVPLVFTVCSIVLVRRFFQGEFPSTYDHTTQLLRCRLTEIGLWKYGTLVPWTSAIGAGVPLNDLYPPCGSLLYCAWCGVALCFN